MHRRCGQDKTVRWHVVVSRAVNCTGRCYAMCYLLEVCASGPEFIGLENMVGPAAVAALGVPVPKRTLRGRLVGADAFTFSCSGFATAQQTTRLLQGTQLMLEYPVQSTL